MKPQAIKPPVKPTGPFASYRIKGADFIKTANTAGGQDPCFAIRPGMLEFEKWSAYFARQYGQQPWEMRAAVNDPSRWVTVPAQWPEWFDTRDAMAAE
jgi:hypothetical protein